jgi:hypothetical protein
MCARHLDGRVQVGALDDVIAADLLLCLGKQPVGDQQLAAGARTILASAAERSGPPCSRTPLSVICSAHELTASIMAASSSAVTSAASSTQNRVQARAMAVARRGGPAFGAVRTGRRRVSSA